MIRLAVATTATDLFSIVKTVVDEAGTTALAVVGFIIALITAAHIFKHNHGAAIVSLAFMLIPVWFLADPTGAVNALKATIP